jgi:hypothetical protein
MLNEGVQGSAAGKKECYKVINISLIAMFRFVHQL